MAKKTNLISLLGNNELRFGDKTGALSCYRFINGVSTLTFRLCHL